MSDYDFSHSFLSWTSTKNNHTPRLRVDAACALTDGNGRREYFLTTMCAGEVMYAEMNLIHLPAYEFAVVYSPSGEYVFFKYLADESRSLLETQKVGETMNTHDGKGSPVVKMKVDMARCRKTRELHGYQDIREAILGNKILNARTEYVDESSQACVTMDYPVHICNVAHGREMWQIDTGAVLLPDFSAAERPEVAIMRMGYIVWNHPDWAEVIVRNPKPAGKYAGKSHFSESRRIAAKNHLYTVE